MPHSNKESYRAWFDRTREERLAKRRVYNEANRERIKIQKKAWARHTMMVFAHTK